jgi:crotonobetainyl-CoA:carnitine CoA-transferase CaiB-like acyl-CoA transferase
VIVRLSGWGQSGPYRELPGFGSLIEGFSGFAHKHRKWPGRRRNCRTWPWPT